MSDNFLCPFSAGGTIRSCSTVRDTDKAKATVTLNMTAATSDLTYTAVEDGYAGNGISVVHVDPGAHDAALAVSVVGKAITVSLATGPAGAITSTAAQVKAAVNAHPAAAALVLCEDEGVGSGVVNALAAANLTGGLYRGCGHYLAELAECALAVASRKQAIGTTAHRAPDDVK